MDSVLTRAWLGDAPFRSIVDPASVAVLRDEVRAAAGASGFDVTATGELAIIASELATNQLRYATAGRVSVHPIERDGVRGVELVAVDRGEGISDPTGALHGVPRAEGSLGIGISSVHRLSDEVDFDIRGGEGTCIRARKFARRVGRRREVGVVARPFPGEPRSGDDAWFGRRGHRLVIAVADGLGHGGEAREAASRAIQAVVANDAPPRELCVLANAAAEGTRGTVLTVVEIDETERRLRITGGGNVMTHVVGPRGTKILSTAAIVLGKPQKQPTFAVEEYDLDPHDGVILFTDGISARVRLDVRDEAFRGHPIVVADHVLKTFGRTNDDALVVVAR